MPMHESVLTRKGQVHGWLPSLYPCKIRLMVIYAHFTTYHPPQSNETRIRRLNLALEWIENIAIAITAV